MKRMKEARQYKDHDKDIRHATNMWQQAILPSGRVVGWRCLRWPHVRACPPSLESRARPKEILTYILERRFPR